MLRIVFNKIIGIQKFSQIKDIIKIFILKSFQVLSILKVKKEWVPKKGKFALAKYEFINKSLG